MIDCVWLCGVYFVCFGGEWFVVVLVCDYWYVGLVCLVCC